MATAERVRLGRELGRLDAVCPLIAAIVVPMAGAAIQVGLVGFFTATVVLYGARNGFHGLAPAPAWGPSRPRSRRGAADAPLADDLRQQRKSPIAAPDGGTVC